MKGLERIANRANRRRVCAIFDVELLHIAGFPRILESPGFFPWTSQVVGNQFGRGKYWTMKILDS